MKQLTTLEECSEGEAGGWRTVCMVELPLFSMWRWDSDSVSSDSSEARRSLSLEPGHHSRAASGWYLDRRRDNIQLKTLYLKKKQLTNSVWTTRQHTSSTTRCPCPLWIYPSCETTSSIICLPWLPCINFIYFYITKKTHTAWKLWKKIHSIY